jgi:hypothetical protein
MLAYQDVVDYLTPKLEALNYDPMPVFNPGPGVNIDATDVSPNMLVIITFTPGGGPDSEYLFEKQAFQVRTVGPQMDYSGAEKLAQDVDGAFYGFQISQEVNGKWWLSVWRIGSLAMLMKDDGDRYHFTGNYILEVEYG